MTDSIENIDLILELYKQRPGKIGWMSLGHWFCEATGLGLIYPLLRKCQTTSEAKRLLQQLKLVKDEVFKKLREYNKSEMEY